MKLRILLLALGLALALVAVGLYADIQIRATAAETAPPLPGDDLIPHPFGVVTYPIPRLRPGAADFPPQGRHERPNCGTASCANPTPSQQYTVSQYVCCIGL
jgi:hypothetical protein